MNPEKAAQLKAAQELFENKEFKEALAAVEPLLKENPKDYDALLLAGAICKANNRFHQAIHYFTTLLQHFPPNEHVYIALGDVYQLSKHYDKALDTYKKVVALNPSLVQAYLPCLNLLEVLHRMDEAEPLWEEAIKIAPNHPLLIFFKGKLLIHQKQWAKARDLLKYTMELNIPAYYHHHVLRQLAIAEERLGDYESAYHTTVKANEALSKSAAAQAVDLTLSDAVYAKSMKGFSRAVVEQWQPPHDAIKAPSFLVGFPRSGTTLLEQMIASHSHFSTSEEALTLGAMLSNIHTLLKRDIPYPEGLYELSEKEIVALRKHYMRDLKARVPTLDTQKHIFDKNPNNLVLMGFANRIFPDGHIIVMLRDPRDVILSCFSQMFYPNPTTVRFFNLESTARHYARVMEVWQHFKENLTMPILEIRYEDLITAPEVYGKRVIEFLGEPWDVNILRFHEHKRSVSTPSAQAITQPIYKEAAGKWRNYEKYIRPVLPILAPYLKRFGYE